MIQIAVSNDSKVSPKICNALAAAAMHAAKAERFRIGSLSIAIVGQRRMAKLHRDFLGVPGPTDVITFDLGTNRRKQTIEAEIVVCSSVAARVSKSRSAGMQMNRALERELVLYVIHGVLHLAGFDDHTEADFRKMHSREDELLSQLSYQKMFIGK